MKKQVYILKATVESGESIIIRGYNNPITAHKEMDRRNSPTYYDEGQTADSVAYVIGGTFSVIVVDVL